MVESKGGVDLEEGARKTKILDVNARYFGLETSVLMENAGRGVADEITRRYGRGNSIGVFCGLGNNGGDGFVVARHLMNSNDVTLFLLGSPRQINTEEAKKNWRILENTDLKRIYIRDSVDLARYDFDRFDVIVDGMLGVGLTGEPREPYRSTLAKINRAKAKKVCIDIPTGYGSELSIRPDLTLSFEFPKSPGAEVLPLGIPSDIEKRIGPGDVKVLRGRRPDAHKGQGGRVMVIGGSSFFRGALEYAGRAAAKIVDLVYHCSPEPCAAVVERIPDFIGTCLEGEVLGERHLPEIVRRIQEYRCDSVLLGPGLGLGPDSGIREETRRMVVGLVRELREKRFVIDADGLNAILEDLDILHGNVVLTPHRGEFRRLSGKEPTPENAADFAETYGCILTLKGPVDIVSDGTRTKFNYTGNPGMATGGTGDVLSGAIAGFAAGNDPFEASLAAVFVTGLSGDLVLQEKGYCFTATDVVERLPEAIRWAEQF
ncbi:MAG: NAD(P)H-hydrate dehydratase [Deltaproteobacteria bacterium]|nr:NAD(P)H-hydrate dehydratase [Deltaproteobacteria bacterium]MBW2120430.1 NAD(P)H-hydrate dehydratase [Deltaproteobacteria bacterium]